MRTILRETEALRAKLSQVRQMFEQVLQAEQILSGAWAGTPEEITCQEVGRRFDEWLGHLAEALQVEGTSPQQQRCLGHLL